MSGLDQSAGMKNTGANNVRSHPRGSLQLGKQIKQDRPHKYVAYDGK